MKCVYCGEQAQYICARCLKCEKCEACTTPKGVRTGSGWYHRLSQKGAELVLLAEDLKKQGKEKPAQNPPS